MFNRKHFKLFLLIPALLVFLTGCGASEEPAENVLQKFKENVVEVKSADMNIQVGVEGQEENEALNLDGTISLQVDRHNEEASKFALNLNLSGGMSAQEGDFSGDLNLDLRTVAKEVYFRLVTLNLENNEEFSQIAPLIQAYTGKWLHVGKDFIPEDLQGLQEKDAETLAKEERLKDLFVETHLLDVTKDYGIETVNGKKVYHYALAFNPEGVREYVTKAALIEGEEMAQEDLSEIGKIADYIDSMEMWIGQEDYNLYKMETRLEGPVTQAGGQVSIEVTLEGAGYNEDLAISAPEEFDEFDPLQLLMGYGAMMNAGEGASDQVDAQ